MAAWALLISGCAVREVRPVAAEPIRRVYVAETTGVASVELGVLNDVVHDTAVRALRERGYEAVAESAQADAVLRAVWYRRQLAAGTTQARMSLRLTLAERDGREVLVVEAVDGLPVAFLTGSRVADLVRGSLAPLQAVPKAP
jgi:hypothetical protein